MNDFYAEHLSEMVRTVTVSNADSSKVDFTQFDKLHSYLERTYPLIHSTMEKTRIGRANLLFKLKCASPKKSPLLLMGHQDVVPAGDAGKWKYPPFSGHIAEGYVWGRGAIDCKSVLLAELEAVEAMLASGFKPDFDLYLAYSDNEEVQVKDKGAPMIVEHLALNGVKLGCVVDEGGALKSGKERGYDGYICSVYLGEKSIQDYEVYKECEGGHSMAPGAGTALGAVAKAIVAIEEHPMPYRLTALVESQLKASAASFSGNKRVVFSNPRENFEKLSILAKEDKELDALLHTTSAFTMASASTQSNVLPTRASAIVNCRILEGDSARSILERFKSLIPQDVCVRPLMGDVSSKATSTQSREFQLIESIVKKLYGPNTLVVPSLLAGGTDSRYYSGLCDNVFRFSGYLKDDRWGSAHSLNERIPCDALESGVRFFTELLHKY